MNAAASVCVCVCVAATIADPGITPGRDPRGLARVERSRRSHPSLAAINRKEKKPFSRR